MNNKQLEEEFDSLPHVEVGDLNGTYVDFNIAKNFVHYIISQQKQNMIDKILENKEPKINIDIDLMDKTPREILVKGIRAGIEYSVNIINLMK